MLDFDHLRDKARGVRLTAAFQARTVENGLARVRIGHPLIEHVDAEELGQVDHAPQQGIRQEIVHRGPGGMPGEAGPEMPARLDGHLPGSELHTDLGVRGEKIGRHLDHGRRGGRDLQKSQEHGGDPLIDKDATMLRVIAELDDVPMAIIRFQQMGLSASPHFSNRPDSGERHQKENAVT